MLSLPDFLFLDLEKVWQTQLIKRPKQSGGDAKDVSAGEEGLSSWDTKAHRAGSDIPDASHRCLHPADSAISPASGRKKLKALNANAISFMLSGPKDLSLFLKLLIMKSCHYFSYGSVESPELCHPMPHPYLVGKVRTIFLGTE